MLKVILILIKDNNNYLIGKQNITYKKITIYPIYFSLKFLSFLIMCLREKVSSKKLKIFTFMENNFKK